MNARRLLGTLLVLLTLNLSQADTVTLTDNGNGTVTMANNEVSMIFSKSDGSVSSFTLASLSATNLIDPGQDYALSLTHIGSGTNDYWVSINSPVNPNYVVVTNTGQIVDVMLDNPIASGNASLYPNGLWDWSEHHVMRAGEAGFYTYWVWRHTASQPQAYYSADSWQGRMNSMFTSGVNADGSTNYAWSFSSSDVPVALSIGGNPPGSTSAGVPQEVVILPFTNYWTQPAGTNYEPGWPAYTQPCGLTSALYPTWTKYDYSSYMGASNSFRPVWGVATEQVGVWSILPSFEHMNGGPTKLKGAVSGNYMYDDDYEGHGLGSSPSASVNAGQVYSKVVGPYFMYANTGNNHLQLWQDAQNEGSIMMSNWPYAWVNEPEKDYPRQRGTLTGTITARTGESTANAVVILGNCATTNWMWQGATNYLFWTTADGNGNFTIPKIRPDNYALFCYVPGIWGELDLSNVVVTAGQTNNLGVIAWNPPHLQQRLWRVGTPDHTSMEYRFGNLHKQYGLWWRYLNEMGTNNLNFTIGQSVESNNWYYAQPELWLTPQSGAGNLTDPTQTNFTAWSPVWNVIFDLTNLPSTNVLCTVALAGCNGCYFYPYINGVNETPNLPNFSNPSQGVFTTSGDDIYRDVVSVGRYQYFQFSFPSNDFVAGTNTFSIHIRQPGLSNPVNAGGTNGYPDLLIGGLIYDFLQMETGPQVIIASPPAAPGGLTATAVSGCEIDLSWTNNATNATSIAVLRSTNGVNFSQIGATANNVTNYADTALPAATTYYYQAVANNADGNSPNSNTAPASTQAAQPPAAPGGLSATAVATNQINLIWIDNSTNEDGFNLERSANGGNYSTIAMTPAGVTNYSDTGLAPGTTYYYRVQSFRSCWGNSAYTTPATAATLAPATPAAPVGLVALPGNSTVSLSWIGSSSASSYNLKRATVSGGPYTVTNNLTGTNFTDTTVANGTTYYYVVSALNAGGESSNSLEVSASPQAFVTAYWTNRITSAAQNWNTSANWTNTAVFPDATSVVANVTAPITASQTIDLNQNNTVGWLYLGAANASSAYTIAPNGGGLIFNCASNENAALIELSTSGGDTISAPVVVSNNLTVLNNSTSHTLTLAGPISGTNYVTYVGPGSVTLATNNTYTGGTFINGGTVICGGNSNVNYYGFGNGSIGFNAGTLQFYGYGGSGGTDWGGCTNTFNIPAGQTGTLLLPPRFGYTIPFTSALTGGGTFNVTVDYVRDFFNGNWSAFTGQVVVRPRTGTGDFRIGNVNGYANAAFYLDSGVNFYTIVNNNLTVDLGELGGASGALIGAGSSSAANPTWRIGARNTTNTFAGIIADAGVTSLTKVGTGLLALTGPNTYSGTTTITAGTLQIGNGGTSGALGAGGITDNASLVYNLYNNVLANNAITGSGSLTQAGFGVLALSGADSYSGATFISAGTLALTNSGSITGSTNINLSNGAIFDVSGTVGHAMTLGSGKAISGEGSIKGNFTVGSGAMLAPGNADLGRLNFNSSLTLNPGSQTILSISHDLQTNNVISVGAMLTLGGTLVVSNVDDPPQAGDVFQLFNAAGYAGNFSSVTLPALTPGLYWNANSLATAGSVSVGIETPPLIGSVNFSGGQLIISGTGGVTNGTYYVLTATNLSTPLSNWVRVATNQFDASGNFSFTNSATVNSSQNFYQLRLP